MSNITELKRQCSVCGNYKTTTEFSSFRDDSGELSYGVICRDCSEPASDDEKQIAREQVNDSQYSKKLDNFNIQQQLADHHRAFGDVAPPEDPGDKPSVSNDNQVFSSEGNEYGSGNGNGKAHPILADAAQFQEAPNTQTPNASDSEQYNKLTEELRLRQELQARLAAQNQANNRPM